jgi:hypothetical protein
MEDFACGLVDKTDSVFWWGIFMVDSYNILHAYKKKLKFKLNSSLASRKVFDVVAWFIKFRSYSFTSLVEFINLQSD